MSMISCDMRYAARTSRNALVSAACYVSSAKRLVNRRQYFFVIREGRGINFVEHGQHLPEFAKVTPTTRADRL